MENLVEIFKVLGNEKRLEILQWLKDPASHFEKPVADISKNLKEKGGVCVGDIQEKAQMSPSTVSHYLKMMQQVGLLNSERHGQWTYYRRNEERIEELTSKIKKDL
ncbi:ArsR/SmtB family transcription factor [Oceanobacillus timonensis]|uniref:ArsR/SmtB family transcription factor n=1 Tax=Oceanobacillus timonensis TaxID=1926285 RepID=UPI0009BBA9E7|nr:metalloregulator ArsR/SmtB family transcription factor [Oceanobacillus timonensis]